jgi:hypothetical protein
VWQVATPEARPTPIEAPSEHLSQVTLMPIVLIEGQQRIVRELADVAFIVIERRTLIARQELEHRFEGADARDIAAVCFPSEPIRKPGEPLALVTARIIVSFNDGLSRTFDVYNDRLLEDTASGSMYLPTPALAALLQSL